MCAIQCRRIRPLSVASPKKTLKSRQPKVGGFVLNQNGTQEAFKVGLLTRIEFRMWKGKARLKQEP